MCNQQPKAIANKRATNSQRDRAVQWDKYYTRPEVARECADLFEKYIGPDTLIIEPSAGAGAFLGFNERLTFAYDIAPDHPDIIMCDFLDSELAPVFREIGDVAMLGNPPFGRRSSLAVAFLNRSLVYAHTVGFILPRSFTRWDTQRKINRHARLVVSHPLRKDAFTLAGAPYSLECVFQIWTRLSFGHDLRLRHAPTISHPDFSLKEYRRETPKSMRHFASNWDFAVCSQGHHDYRPVFSAEDCDPKQRWMMFEAANGQVLSRLLNIDFAALSKARQLVPGFAMHDVVAKYTAMNEAPP